MRVTQGELMNNQQTKNKGGRPPLSQDEPTIRTTITVTASQAEYLKTLGKGKLSKGVQIVTEYHKSEQWRE